MLRYGDNDGVCVCTSITYLNGLERMNECNMIRYINLSDQINFD